MFARLHNSYGVLHIEYSMFHIPFATLYSKFHIPHTILCDQYCIMRISASTARLQRRVHMNGHKLSNNVRKMMPTVGGSKVSGVEGALRRTESAPSQVALVGRWSSICHAFGNVFGSHPAHGSRSGSKTPGVEGVL